MRNIESRKVLANLGVLEEDCIFVGEQRNISDGTLIGSLDKAYVACLEVLKKRPLSQQSIFWRMKVATMTMMQYIYWARA